MSYNVQISNKQYENLIYTDQMQSLTLTEMIGNFLPMFSLTFLDNDFDKLQYLNEKNPITISYQLDENIVANQFIIKPVNPVYTADTYTVALGGYLNKFDYLKGVPKVPYVSGSSVDALIALGQSYFGEKNVLVTTGLYDAENNTSNLNDKMNWLHNGKNARNFVQDIWKHMYSPDSLPMLGIGLDGFFKIYDVATLLSLEPKYSFSCDGEEGYEVYADATVTDNAGGNTSLFGYQSNRKILIEDSLEIKESIEKPKVTMNTSTQMNEMELPERQLTPMFQSSNVHKHWYEAYHQNFVRWSALNNNTLSMTVYNNLLPLNIMDLIYVKFPQQNRVGKSSDGNFIISRKDIIFDSLGNVTTEYIGIREVAQNVNTAKEVNTRDNITTYKI